MNVCTKDDAILKICSVLGCSNKSAETTFQVKKTVHISRAKANQISTERSNFSRLVDLFLLSLICFTHKMLVIFLSSVKICFAFALEIFTSHSSHFLYEFCFHFIYHFFFLLQDALILSAMHFQ